MLGIFFPMTIFLQGVLGYSAIKAGLAMSPMSITILLVAPVSGRLSDRIGTRWILFGGLLLQVIGILYIVRESTLDATPWSLMPALALTGFGMACTFAPMTTAVMRDVPPRIAGSASGILNTMRNIGQVLGIAVLGSLLQHQVSTHVGDRLETSGVDPATQSRVITYAQQSQFERIDEVSRADQITTIVAAVRSGFTESIHDTFTAGALLCLAAAAAAFFLKDRAHRPVEVTTESGSAARAPAD